MVWVLRTLGIWLLERFGTEVLRDLRAGNTVGARRRARRLGMLAVRVAAVSLLVVTLLFILLVVLLVRLLS